jgi:hypothetical protein
MDAVDPILVTLAGSLGRQPMDQQIFRRTTIVKSAAEIDFDAADATDPLDASQFGLTLLQRLIGVIALARDFQYVLPQTVGCRCPARTVAQSSKLVILVCGASNRSHRSCEL